MYKSYANLLDPCGAVADAILTRAISKRAVKGNWGLISNFRREFNKNTSEDVKGELSESKVDHRLRRFL